MLAIVTSASPKGTRPFFALRPYLAERDRLGTQDILLYTLHGCYRPLFSKILNHLQKKHSRLVCSEELCIPNHTLYTQVFPKLQEVFTLLGGDAPKKIAILCDRDETRLPELFRMIAPFTKSVSLITDSPARFEPFAKEALKEYGFTVTQRNFNQSTKMDVTLLLSGNFDLSFLKSGYLINLSPTEITAPIPTLCDFTSRETEEFLVRHPNLQLKRFLLHPEYAKITKLIWKYC